MNVALRNQIPLSYAYNAGVSGKVSVPVPPSMIVYSNFKNVHGVAVEGTPGYSMDKLKILDTLIDRLRSVKNQPDLVKEVRGLSDERIDALIEQYGKELHNAVAKSPTPYSVPQGITTGMLVDIAA